MESALRAGAGAAGLTLIETLAWTGTGFARLPLHLARLAQSAHRLGWPCNLATVEAALYSEAPANPARIRLTLDRKGAIAVGSAPMPAAIAQWRVGLAAAALTSDDPWLTIKSSHRPAYDAARAALPATLDEVIFQNQRGEVCDGTITTVFFDAGQGLRTPPLSCGLLPGVLRAERAVPEQLLQVRDLPKVQLWLGNSLRGLSRARWVG